MDSKTSGIITRMESVRGKRRERIAELSEESSRLTDWREHVRSAPLLTLAASVAVGAFGVATFAGGPTQSVSPKLGETNTSKSTTLARTAASTAFSIVMPMLTRYVKQRVATAVAGAVAKHAMVSQEERDDRRYT